MLFNLHEDEGEVSNIAAQRPEEHKKLATEMMRYFRQVEARLPKVSPDNDQDFYEQTKEDEKRMAWGPFVGNRRLDDDGR